MKKLIMVMILTLVLGGCATSKFCQDQSQVDQYKAYIHSALSVVQVGYPIVAALAGVGATSPVVMGAVATIDASLDGLGKLAYDVVCPGMTEVQKAKMLAEKALAAKAELGVR